MLVILNQMNNKQFAVRQLMSNICSSASKVVTRSYIEIHIIVIIIIVIIFYPR